jgi:transposase
MTKDTLFVGLDVHVSSISVAVAENGRDGAHYYIGRIGNEPGAVAKMMRKLGRKGRLKCCYEAGPCGYVLYRQMEGMGIDCAVVAPSLIPKKSGERVKTDKRDALKLAALHRSGHLTAVWVPDEANEALRELLRAREVMKKDEQAYKRRIGMFLHRHGLKHPDHLKKWSSKYRQWLQALKFEHRPRQLAFDDYVRQVESNLERLGRVEEAIYDSFDALPESQQAVVRALECFRGVERITSMTLIAEVGQFLRFGNAAQTMDYVGLVPSEHSSGGPGKERRGSITKTGNAHVRRVIVEAAWHYRHRPAVSHRLRKRQVNAPQAIKDIAMKAQHRLHRRYFRLLSRGKPSQVVVTAIAREFVGFLWHAAVQAELQSSGLLDVDVA